MRIVGISAGTMCCAACMLLVLVCIAGCLMPQQDYMSLKINSDLSAAVACRYDDIRSGAETPEERAAEMQRFYDGRYRVFTDNIKANWRLETMEVDLLNKTETGCDAELTGTTSDVIPLLAAMEFNVTRDGNRYTIVHLPQKLEGHPMKPPPEPRPVFSLTYDGPIVEHNAPLFDTGTWVMEWESPRFQTADIKFVIEVTSDEVMTGEADAARALFVDAALEKVVRVLAGKPAGTLLVDDLADIVYLDASGAGIRLLGGIEQLVSLRRLDLSRNEIRFLDPLALLPELRELDLSDNQIGQATGLAGSPRLETLNLSRNHLFSVEPLASLENLRCLDLSDNHVGTKIEALASLPSLRSLTIINDHLMDLRALSGFTGLEELNLSSTQVGAGLEHLKKFSRLRRLDLSNSRFQDLSGLPPLPCLQYLNLSGIQIASLEPLAALTGLRELFLSHNRISDCGPLAGLVCLLQLDLSSNRIEDITPLKTLTRMTVLDLSSNRVSDLAALDRMNRLISLKAADNQVADIEPVQRLVWLNFLDLSGNRVSDLEALVDAHGIALGDIVLLDGNPLDEDDLPIVKTLEKRHVRVRHTIRISNDCGK